MATGEHEFKKEILLLEPGEELTATLEAVVVEESGKGENLVVSKRIASESFLLEEIAPQTASEALIPSSLPPERMILREKNSGRLPIEFRLKDAAVLYTPDREIDGFRIGVLTVRKSFKT